MIFYLIFSSLFLYLVHVLYHSAYLPVLNFHGFIIIFMKSLIGLAPSYNVASSLKSFLFLFLRQGLTMFRLVQAILKLLILLPLPCLLKSLRKLLILKCGFYFTKGNTSYHNRKEQKQTNKPTKYPKCNGLTWWKFTSHSYRDQWGSSIAPLSHLGAWFGRNWQRILSL
jgi:hypothetical protein